MICISILVEIISVYRLYYIFILSPTTKDDLWPVWGWMDMCQIVIVFTPLLLHVVVSGVS